MPIIPGKKKQTFCKMPEFTLQQLNSNSVYIPFVQ